MIRELLSVGGQPVKEQIAALSMGVRELDVTLMTKGLHIYLVYR